MDSRRKLPLVDALPQIHSAKGRLSLPF
jgi:hypothetical protein